MTRIEAIIAALNTARYLLDQEASARRHEDNPIFRGESFAARLEDLSSDICDWLVEIESQQ